MRKKTVAGAKRPTSPAGGLTTARSAAAAAGQAAVTLRTESGACLSIPLGAQLQRAAMSWSYTVRNRRRWVTQQAARDQQARRCAADLEELEYVLSAATRAQRLRTPSEIVRGHRGTCQESFSTPWLTLLWPGPTR